MKKIIYIFLAASVFLTSCRDEDKDPWSGTDTMAPYVFLDVVNQATIDLTNLSGSAYSADLVAPGNNVASYNVNIGFNGAEPILLKSITSFPSTLTISPAEIASAVGISIDDFGAGDFVNVFATTIDVNGLEWDPRNVPMSTDINNPAQKQAFQYTIFFVCPSDIGGTMSYTYEALYSPYYGDLTSFPADGSIELIALDAFGSYTISDASFGGLVELYAIFGAEPVAINMLEACGTITFSGADVYGDVYGWNISDINGASMKVQWYNSYGDSGTLVLTRDDGVGWPTLIGG